MVVRSDVLDKLTNGTEAKHVRHSADPRFGFGLVRNGDCASTMQRLGSQKKITYCHELHVQHLGKMISFMLDCHHLHQLQLSRFEQTPGPDPDPTIRPPMNNELGNRCRQPLG